MTSSKVVKLRSCLPPFYYKQPLPLPSFLFPSSLISLCSPCDTGIKMGKLSNNSCPLHNVQLLYLFTPTPAYGFIEYEDKKDAEVRDGLVEAFSVCGVHMCMCVELCVVCVCVYVCRIVCLCVVCVWVCVCVYLVSHLPLSNLHSQADIEHQQKDPSTHTSLLPSPPSLLLPLHYLYC